MSGGDRSAGDSAPLIPSFTDGQAPPPVAAAPESLPPPSRPLEAEDDPVVVPDTVKVASPEASKAGTSVAVTPLTTSPLLEAEEDTVVVPDTVEAASSEASDSEVGAVPLMPTSLPVEADEDLLIVPDAVDAASSEVTKVGAGGGVPPLPPFSPLEAEDDHLVVPATVDDASLEISEAVVPSVVLTDELRDKIVKQVEYYFSDENLPTDEFMLKFVKKNKDGFVPVGVIASFRKMKKLVQDQSIIEAALRTSSKLVVSSNGKRVRRLHPLPCSELKDVKKRTVLVENLPLGFSMENIQEKFGTVGKIMKITINDPHAVGESAGSKKPDFMLSNKVHAIVEYEAVEAAEKAVSTLSDERNWRTGMRVILLAKRSVMGSGKHIQSSKENHGTVSKKNNEGQSSKEQKLVSEKKACADSGEVALDKENVNSDVGQEEVRQHQKTNANSGQKGRYRSQGKGLSGQGNVSSPTISGSVSVNKPISGPRMPDGTRGFVMGRGRPLPPPKAEKAEE
ncbi:la-related protein 6A-like isoform X2 [Lolium rigidum]|uniref:la-related protein 6A-like isoform X2 n=1 Tax=Lolium rigidum TaxID=89674 RepID=UPI001F5E0529|nr:la-related protein 6A-like isoform X2 [Lolium rigidum]